MSRESVLARGRAAAERGMVDACVITRLSGEYTDEATGVITPTYATVYTGKCRLQQTEAQASATDSGEARRLMVPRQLQLPVATSTGVLADDLVEITACVNDSDLVGKVFRVREEMAKTESTSRRLGIQEVTS